MRGNFDNTAKLVRFILRREIIISSIWIILLVAFSATIASGMAEMFPDNEARLQIAAIYDNPIMVSIMGPVYGLEDYTAGAMYGGMMLLWCILAVAVMNIFLVVRHTRADEERGRGEVVRSLPVGRLANINATMIAAFIINFILAVLTGLGLAATNVEGMDFAGCMFYGAVLAAGGFVFAGITAVFCQLSSSTSGAVGLSFLALGGFYMLRAVGDVGSEALSCISPLGLAQRTQAFVGNELIPLLVLLVEVVAISALAYKLNTIRDLGQGFIPARPGRKEAKASLLSSFGLSYRLLKTAIIIWLISMFSLGASYGSIIGQIDQFVGDSPDYLKVIGIPDQIVETMSDEQKSEIIVEYFGMFVTSMMTLVGLIPLLIAALKLRSEEKEGRLEHVLSRSVSRTKYLLNFVIIAFVLSIVMQCVTGMGLYSAAAAGENNPFVLDTMLQSYLVYLPAIWIMIGVAVFLVGLFPKATIMAWVYYGFTFFMVFMGSFPELFPEWLTNVSPMKHIPKLPLEEINYTSLAVMTAIAAVLTIAGFVGYRKRDMI